MFTGIIQGLGTIVGARKSDRGAQITIESDFPLEGAKIGDSIAVNGACLTATTLSGRRFTADVSPETLRRSTFSSVQIRDRVNLERAMRLSERIDGHLVSGHIDGTSTLMSRRAEWNAILLTYSAPRHLTRYMIEKGSVAIDGVSLTINESGAGEFSVSVIPHTAEMTTIGLKKVGDSVNIETDLIGKYVERFVLEKQENSKTASRGIDMALLAKSGFL